MQQMIIVVGQPKLNTVILERFLSAYVAPPGPLLSSSYQVDTGYYIEIPSEASLRCQTSHTHGRTRLIGNYNCYTLCIPLGTLFI